MSNATLWRNTDPADGAWSLGHVLDGEPHAAITLEEADLRNIHAILGDILNLEGQDQDVYAADDESEAQPPTPEEEARQKVWDAIAIGQRMEALFLARSRLEIAVHKPHAGQRMEQSEVEDNPVWVAIVQELDELDERLRAL